MIKITFFTTSITKLAHLRYLAEGHSIDIKGFKQRTYRASYHEPRLYNREELLQKSYKSALEQAQKAKINPKKHFFILEDTSVKIDAFSEEKETPGVDVKYWMQKQIFDILDAELKAKNNNRKVTVRSDLLLHMPDYFKLLSGSTKDYEVFYGEQEGTVVEKEYDIKTNPVFPWLDNSSFNKWFVPKGENCPISLLPIDKADKYDFRAHAFKKLLLFINEPMTPEARQEQQYSMNLLTEPTIIVCGPACAGKTTISQYLLKEYGYIHLEASDFMYLSYYKRHGFKNIESIAEYAKQALINKPEIAAEKILEYLPKSNGKAFVISGFRAIQEIEWLMDNFPYKGVDFKIVYINASQDIRFKRYISRNRDRDEVSIEKFNEADDAQDRMGLPGISSLGACVHVTNEDSKDSYFAKFCDALLSNVKPTPARDFDINLLNEIRSTALMGDAIMLTLLKEWRDDESRPFFTTNQISKLTENKFKDSVSRYFNKDFSAYFEVMIPGGSNPNKFRLSNTGYCAALEIYHRLIQKTQNPENHTLNP